MTNSFPLLQMFFEYSPEEPLHAVLEQAAVCRAEISREERRITLEVCFDRYVSMHDLQALGEGLQMQYGIRTVNISPRFPMKCAADSLPDCCIFSCGCDIGRLPLGDR